MKITYLVEKEVECAGLEDFRKTHPDDIICLIDGKNIIEECYVCGLPILEGEDHSLCSDNGEVLAAHFECTGGFNC